MKLHFIYCVCICACVHVCVHVGMYVRSVCVHSHVYERGVCVTCTFEGTCHCKHLEVRAQFAGVGSLLSLCGFWGLISGRSPGSGYLHSLIHLANL